MEEALEAVVHSYDLVAFGERGIRFFRVGAEPPLRGTLVHLGTSNPLFARICAIPRSIPRNARPSPRRDC